ncbi:COG1470 family protein [Streptomyces sp. NPDC054956]
MTTSAHLDASPAAVMPGDEVRIPLELRNSGNVVEAYGFEVLGPAAAWTVVEPSTLSLYPDTAGTVHLVVRPPRDSAVPPGELAYGVRVLPQEQPEHTTVPEGLLDIGAFADFGAELTPRLSQGSGGARFQLALDNRGNHPLTVSLSAKDQSDALRFSLPDTPTVVGPGQAAFVRIPVRARRRMWRGMPTPHPFQVTAAPAEDGVAPAVLDGTLLHRPVLSATALRALLAVVALLAALAVIWFTLLRPAVRGAAKEAVKGPVQAAESKAAEAKEAADKAAAGAGGGGGGKPSPSPGVSTGAAPGTGPAPQAQANLFSTRLTAEAGAGATKSETYTVPDDKVLRLTDLVLENPQGDAGTVTFSVGGKPLLAPALENFREQDFHWASALLAGPKQEITITLTCRTIGKPPAAPAPTKCSASALLSGTLE